MKNCRYVIKSVNTIPQRDKVINEIHAKLRDENLLESNIKIVKESVSKISVYYLIEGNVDILIRVYLVVVVPIQIDLSALDSLHGKIYFDLRESINTLTSILKKLKSLEGERHICTPISARKDLETTLTSLLS